jgi:hypothetical protein
MGIQTSHWICMVGARLKMDLKLIHKANVDTGKLGYETAIISPKYFPGTEIDYYVARPLNMKLLQYGTLSEIHKYAWINEERGQLRKGDNAYMISTSNWYKDPYEYYGNNFEDINPFGYHQDISIWKISLFCFCL